MSPALWLRRGAVGAWALVVLAAVVVPALTVVVTAHRGHWPGVGDGGGGFVLTWAGRVWAAVLTVAVAGWASGAAPMGGGRGRRVAEGAALGAFAGGVCLLGALPAWVWLWRVGLGVPAVEALLAAGIVAAAGAVAGAAGPAGAGEAGGALAGMGVGAALVWAAWGAFA